MRKKQEWLNNVSMKVKNMIVKHTIEKINKLTCFRYKEMASFKIESLQKSLAESVPASHLEEANREFADLTAKYRDLMQREQVWNWNYILKSFENLWKEKIQSVIVAILLLSLNCNIELMLGALLIMVLCRKINFTEKYLLVLQRAYVYKIVIKYC